MEGADMRRLVFDADGEMVSSEVVLERGPHPDLDSDEAFCDVTIPALGL
jgi:hypothetical protein